MSTYHAPLVGVNFRPKESRDAVKELAPGDRLLLEAEPTNPYDANAVRVLSLDGDHLGYIARDSNTEIAQHLADGKACTCMVHSFLGTIKPLLEITLTGDESVHLESGIDE